MSTKRISYVVLVASAVMLALGGKPRMSGSAQTMQSATAEWTLEGRVYEGDVGVEPPHSRPLQDVTVSLYGSNNPYPDSGTFLRSTTTDAEGWYGLIVYDDDAYEYFHIRETDPAGYTSVGATTLDGTVRTSNWIEYVIPLDGKTLTGNKFWDRTLVLSGRVYKGEVGDESQPLEGVTVSLHGANNPYPDAGELIATTTTNAEGWYGLTVPDGYEYYHIRETDPAGYVSIDATTISGTVRASNWIEYSIAIPLDEQTLTGNKFWILPTSNIDLQIDHVELTQAIQCKDNSHCADNSVPLIAGKDTYVRVYVKVVNASSVPNVSADAVAHLPSGDVSGVPLYMPITAKANPQRSQATDTINFYFPASSVSSSGTLEVMVNPHYTVAESNYANNTTTVSLNFVSTPRLDIVPVRIYYNYGGQSGVINWGMPYYLSGYLENILPVGEVKWHFLPGPPLEWKQQIGPGGASWGSLLAKLADMKKKNTSVPTGAHWYAMIPFKLPQGYISGMASMPGKVAAGRVPISYENLENAADIMAHELGHNFNRQHTPCGVSDPDLSYPYPNARLGDYGWDPQIAAGGKVFSWPSGYVVPATSFDVMSYCQDEWISEYTYQAILNYRGYSVASTGTAANDQQAAEWGQLQLSAGASQPYLFASGIITGEQVELDPWAILDRPVGFDDDAGAGEYQLRLISGTVTLFERDFDAEMSMPSPLSGLPASVMQEDTVLSFYEVLPWYTDTERVQVWHGGSMLAERVVSGHAPVVGLTSPGSGDFWASDGEYVIEWTASDDDVSDSLWFDVAFSRDNGTTWEVIATRLEETHLDVRSDQFPGTDQAMLRVFASDGLLTSEATVEPFSIASKSPQAVIALPQAGGTVPPGMQVLLKGYAYDPEDGMLDSSSLSWSSDRDGALGTGSQVSTVLSQGLHTITLTATDSDTNPATGEWLTYTNPLTPVIEYPMDGCYGLNGTGDEIIVLFPDTIVTGTLQIFDITNKNWYIKPVPAPGYPVEGRWGQDIVSMFQHTGDNVCYLSGGSQQEGGGRTKDLWKYYPFTNTASYIGPFTDTVPPYDETPVFNFHASWYVPWVGDGGAICVAGGVDHNHQIITSTQCYDLHTGQFNERNADLGSLPEPWWGMADGWQITDEGYELWIANGVAQDGTLLPVSAYIREGMSNFDYGPEIPDGLYRLEGDAWDNQFYTLNGSRGGFWSGEFSLHLAPCPTCHSIYLPCVLRNYQ